MRKNESALPIELTQAKIGNVIHLDNLWFNHDGKNYRAGLKKEGLINTYNLYINDVLQAVELPEDIIPHLYNMISSNKIEFESDLHIYNYNKGFKSWLEIPKPEKD